MCCCCICPVLRRSYQRGHALQDCTQTVFPARLDKFSVVHFHRQRFWSVICHAVGRNILWPALTVPTCGLHASLFNFVLCHWILSVIVLGAACCLAFSSASNASCTRASTISASK